MHEWETSDFKSLCDWCGDSGYILEKETPFERYLKEMLNGKHRSIFHAIQG